MVTLETKLVGLDSNVFIYFFEADTTFGPRARLIVEYLASNKARAVTSILTLSELLAVRESKIPFENFQQKFLEIPNLSTLNVDKEVAVQAANIRRDYKFSLPDCIQLATSLQAKADYFISNDMKLTSFKEVQVITLKDLTI